MTIYLLVAGHQLPCVQRTVLKEVSRHKNAIGFRNVWPLQRPGLSHELGRFACNFVVPACLPACLPARVKTKARSFFAARSRTVGVGTLLRGELVAHSECTHEFVRVVGSSGREPNLGVRCVCVCVWQLSVFLLGD